MSLSVHIDGKEAPKVSVVTQTAECPDWTEQAARLESIFKNGKM